MKKVVLIVIMLLWIYPMPVMAQRGCCSSHGGVVGCSSNGKQVCADGTLSPSCTCHLQLFMAVQIVKRITIMPMQIRMTGLVFIRFMVV